MDSAADSPSRRLFSEMVARPDADVDLAEGALLVACEEYPELDRGHYLGHLDLIAARVSDAAAGRRDPDLLMHLVSRELFEEQGFRGNTDEYYDPRNSYLNEVLDRRKGIPITLSAVAMAVGARAGLDVAGVGLPGHFVAKAVEAGREVYFDPFHGGRLLSPDQCAALVKQVTGLPFVAGGDGLRAVPLGLIVLRMLTNLKGVYLRGGDFRRAARVIGRLSQLAPGDPLQRRDLGATLLRAGQPGQAIGHLEAYLAAVPGAEDAGAVRKLLDQARAAVAQWN